MTWLELANGNIPYTQKQAEAVVAGYAFGVVPVAWGKTGSSDFSGV